MLLRRLTGHQICRQRSWLNSPLFVFLFTCLTLRGEDSPAHFLSFIMPCYNCEKTVEGSIESIFRQQLSIPFELICTDDGSTDRTHQVLLSLQSRHSNMKVFQHEKNLGGGPARNTCVRYSQGDLLFCLDSDNLLDQPDDIQQLIDFLDREKVDVACFEILQFFEGDLKLTNQWVFSTPTGRFSASDILKTCMHPAASGNYLFTRKSFDAVKGYSDAYVLDTFYFGFEQAYAGFPIAYLPGRRYLHRSSPDGYYARGARAKVLNQEFIQILLNHPEFFTPETLHFLSESAKNGQFPSGWEYTQVITKGLLRFAE